MATADVQHAEIAVLGSGPGGSITANLLAQAGRDVLLVEEGPFFPQESCPAFSRQEMEQKYRNGGITLALGKTKIAYVEGRCVGGGSEINSALYHRTPPEILDDWRRRFQVESLRESDLESHFQAIEHELSVGLLPGPAPPASLRLHDGAQRLGWRSLEVPRWFRYSQKSVNQPDGTRQSMTRTFVPAALAAGARLLAETRVSQLRRRSGHWQIRAERRDDDGRLRELLVEADNVFIACGAIQTPALLQRSGLGRRAGATLHVHPTLKVVAHFDDEINPPGMGVPVHQVKEFAPRISFGCSISATPHLALALLNHPSMLGQVSRQARHLAVYYAMTCGGRGQVNTWPGLRDPLVRYQLSEPDLVTLGEALKLLCQCLFAGGATTLYPGFPGSPELRSPEQLSELPSTWPGSTAPLMTIHLFSSCPLGEAPQCVADSFGRVHGAPGLWIADASLLPGPPGVNPQGTIMALARRNVLAFLGRL